MIKYCPLLITREEVKAVLVGQGDYTVQKMRPCLKEKCVAYCKHWCSQFENSVEIDDREVGETMKAEEMFRCLGYEKTSKKDSESIIYEKVETYFSDFDDKDTIKKSTYIHYISFDLNYNTVNSSVQNRDSFDGELATPINAMEMLAVVKQCKEIGWLD